MTYTGISMHPSSLASVLWAEKYEKITAKDGSRSKVNAIYYKIQTYFWNVLHAWFGVIIIYKKEQLSWWSYIFQLETMLNFLLDKKNPAWAPLFLESLKVSGTCSASVKYIEDECRRPSLTIVWLWSFGFLQILRLPTNRRQFNLKCYIIKYDVNYWLRENYSVSV